MRRSTSVPSRSGSPRSRMTRSGASSATDCTAVRPSAAVTTSLPCARRAIVERALQPRVVVDDEHSGHASSFCVVVAVGVSVVPLVSVVASGIAVAVAGDGQLDHHGEASSRGVLGHERPAHDAHEAAGHGETEAQPVAAGSVTDPLERPRRSAPCRRRGRPGPRSTTRSCTVSAMRPAVRRTSAFPLWRRAFSTTLASTRSSRPRSARTRGRSGSRSTVDAGGVRRRANRGHDGVEQVDRVAVRRARRRSRDGRGRAGCRSARRAGRPTPRSTRAARPRPRVGARGRTVAGSTRRP